MSPWYGPRDCAQSCCFGPGCRYGKCSSIGTQDLIATVEGNWCGKCGCGVAGSYYLEYAGTGTPGILGDRRHWSYVEEQFCEVDGLSADLEIGVVIGCNPLSVNIGRFEPPSGPPTHQCGVHASIAFTPSGQPSPRSACDAVGYRFQGPEGIGYPQERRDNWIVLSYSISSHSTPPPPGCPEAANCEGIGHPTFGPFFSASFCTPYRLSPSDPAHRILLEVA